MALVVICGLCGERLHWNESKQYVDQDGGTGDFHRHWAILQPAATRDLALELLPPPDRSGPVSGYQVQMKVQCVDDQWCVLVYINGNYHDKIDAEDEQAAKRMLVDLVDMAVETGGKLHEG